MKKFFAEFKTFISRGNVLDMAVGVIVGGAFTAIVSGLSDHILKPIINWLLALIFGSNSLEGIYTFLKKATLIDAVTGAETVDLANSIYIDWGAFINAIINFFLIAIVLFVIVKTFNRIQEGTEKAKNEWKENTPTAADRKQMKKLGIKLTDKEAVSKFMEEKKQAELIKKEEEEKKAEAEKLEKEMNSTEGLLKQIKTLLENNSKLSS